MAHVLLSGLLVALISTLPACEISGLGPAEEHSSFVSAKATPDAKYGVFSHHRYVYRPAAGWRAFPDGGIPSYIEDTDTLCVYVFAEGGTRVIRREDNEYFQPGQGNFYVSHITDTKAVISQGGQRRSDYFTEYRQYMLDIPTGRLTPLPIKAELAALGREQGYFYLVDELGTLVFVTAPLGEDSNYVGVEANPKEVWIRHPDGRYEKAATVIHYYAYADGLVHYYDYGRHEYLVYDTRTHSARTPPERYPPSTPDVTFDLVVSPDDRKKLSIGRKAGDRWVYEDAGVSGEGLY